MNFQKLLNAREQRTKKRLAFSRAGYASISLSFNIPGAEKSTKRISKAFEYSKKMLEDYLLANRIFIDEKQSIQFTDVAGDFYLSPIIETSKSITKVKDLCEKFEERHPLGRIIEC